MATGSDAAHGLTIAWAGSAAFQHLAADRLSIQLLDPAAPWPPTRLYALPFLHDRHRHVPSAGTQAPDPPLAGRRASEISELVERGFCTAVVDMGVGRLEPWPDRPQWAKSALRGLTGAAAGEHARRFATVVHHGGSARDAVQEQVSAGADLVKLIATGSGLAPQAEAVRPVMDDATIVEAVEAAKTSGHPVMVHCHGGVVADRVIVAGIHSIEHGLFLSDEQLRAMRETGVRLTLTPGVYRNADPTTLGPVLARLVRTAMDLELQLGVGTDGDRGTMLDQVRSLVELGMPFERALRAAADWTGSQDALITPDRPLVLFANDPAADVRWLAHPVAIARASGATDA